VELRSDSDGLLVQRPVPTLIPEQVDQFTATSIEARVTRSFDPLWAQNALVRGTAREALAIDIGGDKLISARYGTHDGKLRPNDVEVRQNEGGRGYVKHLEELAGRARRDKLKVGISFAGLTEGTKLMAAPNLPVLFCDLRDRYGLDFANLFPSVVVANDAEAGIMAASVEVIKRHRAARHVIYVINGSGLGGAVLTDSTIFACEPGHIKADPKLNPFKTNKPCGLLGRTHVCLEGVAASKAGIEATWLQQRGEPSSGRQIAARYLLGEKDPDALRLYDNSARVTAHAVAGLAKAFRIRLDRACFVAHGGIFQVPGYGERVLSILDAAGSSPLGALFTSHFSTNACLDGAAIAAVLKDVTVCARIPSGETVEAF